MLNEKITEHLGLHVPGTGGTAAVTGSAGTEGTTAAAGDTAPPAVATTAAAGATAPATVAEPATTAAPATTVASRRRREVEQEQEYVEELAGEEEEYTEMLQPRVKRAASSTNNYIHVRSTKYPPGPNMLVRCGWRSSLPWRSLSWGW